MGRDAKFLGTDLANWIETSTQKAKHDIAAEALEDASEWAPEWTGFLADQGYAFVDGKLVEETQGITSAPRRTEIKPEGGYNHDISVVFRAGRVTSQGTVFDYAYYVGVVRPDWLRYADTMHWIESALHPALHLQTIAKWLDIQWPKLQTWTS